MRVTKKEFKTTNKNFFDIKMEKNHNFVLSNGSIAHNCGTGVGFSVERQYVESRRSPNFATVFCAAARLKMPRSPLLDLYRETHSSMNTPISGFSLYATELFAKARWEFASHHAPVFASRIRSSVRFDRLIRADRRTPPTTTISAILHTRSWHSIDVSFLPAALLKVSQVKRKRSSRGFGPDALPPNVLSLAPEGRTLEISHFGI